MHLLNWKLNNGFKNNREPPCTSKLTQVNCGSLKLVWRYQSTTWLFVPLQSIWVNTNKISPLTISLRHAELILQKGIVICTRHNATLLERKYHELEHMFVDFYLVEEFFYAALQLKQMDWAQFFLQMTRANYPKSIKSMRMLA